MTEMHTYAVYFHPQALDVLGEPIAPYLTDGPGGKYLLCREIDTGGAFCELELAGNDAEGKPLDGASNYVIHFDKNDIPPVEAFWSVTLYDNDGFQVANPLNRFAVSSWMPFHYNPDGSLDLYFQNESPGADKEANWLPAPRGPFNLTMRLYAPKSAALTGKWNPPPVMKVQERRRSRRSSEFRWHRIAFS